MKNAVSTLVLIALLTLSFPEIARADSTDKPSLTTS